MPVAKLKVRHRMTAQAICLLDGVARSFERNPPSDLHGVVVIVGLSGNEVAIMTPESMSDEDAAALIAAAAG